MMHSDIETFSHARFRRVSLSASATTSAPASQTLILSPRRDSVWTKSEEHLQYAVD